MRTLAKLVTAFLLPWIVLELVLRLVGYHAPDNRDRVLLFPKFPAFYQPDRDLAWTLRPHLEWKGRELVQPFSTNEAGNRFTSEGEEKPTVDCIGDSTTFGYGSVNGRTYPAALARLLGEPVRNLGVPGYTSQSARLLAERNDDPAPVTLVMTGFNDHFPAYQTAEEELWVRRGAYACFASRVCATMFDYLAQPRADTRPPLVDFTPSISPVQYRDNLVATVRTLREKGSEPVLLVYPPILSDEDTRAGVASHWKHPRALVDANIDAHPVYQEITREVAAAEDVALVDLLPVFDSGGNETLHIDWVHPNDAGYQVIAETLVGPVRAALGR
ncbi:MAG: GDSL-type esterase/lipase family protein [Candidatus Binatia bacterium]|nr:GDSL-type esterase/lipase family protein [Candidatus Binatia bacterium]